MFHPCEKFKIAYTYYMNPYDSPKDAIVQQCKPWMVGMVGAQKTHDTDVIHLPIHKRLQGDKCDNWSVL